MHLLKFYIYQYLTSNYYYLYYPFNYLFLRLSANMLIFNLYVLRLINLTYRYLVVPLIFIINRFYSKLLGTSLNYETFITKIFRNSSMFVRKTSLLMHIRVQVLFCPCLFAVETHLFLSIFKR